jgi:unsaturated rhamnogalacturonyl hydrolase
MHTKNNALTAPLISVLLTSQALGCSNGSTTYFDACDEPVTADECYSLRRDPSSEQVGLATDIALRYVDEHPVEREEWDWTSGVLMFALTELYRVTRNEAIHEYYQAWLDFHIEEGYRIFWSDSCPPALTALALLKERENADYQQVVDDVLQYLQAAPRIEEGGISHLGVIDILSIWVDSLFMFGMVLTRHGELADDPDALALMSEQLSIFSELLQHENGLLVHAYGWPEDFDDDIYWGRGNGWVVASLADYLRVRFLRNEADPEALEMFQSQVEGVLATQDAVAGMWWTVMNRPGETYLETSATALLAYGMARAYRYGLLGHQELDAAKRAVEAVKGAVRTDEQGRPYVTGISGPTGVSTFEGYAGIPVEDDLNYGVGATILALIETSGL